MYNFFLFTNFGALADQKDRQTILFFNSGCIQYRKGWSRYDQPFFIRINPSYIQYSVASFTGGNIAFVYTANGAGIEWGQTNMPAFTTYELVLNITGTQSSSGSENEVILISKSPCEDPENTACDADERLHLVLVD